MSYLLLALLLEREEANKRRGWDHLKIAFVQGMRKIRFPVSLLQAGRNDMRKTGLKVRDNVKHLRRTQPVQTQT